MPLTLRSVRLDLGGRRILDDVHLDLPHEHGLVTISGPSGSGKSLLLEVIGGLRGPTAGIVEVDGRERTNCDFAWVPQRPILLPELSVTDNIWLATRFRYEVRSRIEALLSALGMADVASSPCRQLSGGETQRVCFARAAVAPSRVILADEPTGQLDHASTTRVVEAIRLLARSKLIVVVTHDQVVAGEGDTHLRLTDGTLEPA